MREEMESYLEELFVGFEDLREEDLKKYLLKPLGSERGRGRDGEAQDSEGLQFLFLDLSKLFKLRKLIRQQQPPGEGQQFEWQGGSLLRLSAIVYSNVVESDDLNARLTACHLFLHLCHCPLAAVSGISTTYVLKNICSVIQKSLVDVLSGRSQGKRRPLDEDAMALEEGDESSRDLDPSILHSLLQDYHIFLPLYSNRGEEYLLEAFADTLVTAVCLTSVKDEYFGSHSLAKGTLAIFALRNEATLSATYRSLLPILTLVGRDPRLPDSNKSKLLCHDACLEVVLAIVSSSQHVLPKKRADESRRLSRRVSIESTEEDDASPSREPENFHGISMPFVCAIGFTQRMMMTSSEKMIPRAQLITSLIKIISAVHEGDDNFESLIALFKAKHHKKTNIKKGKADRGRNQSQRLQYQEEDLEEDHHVDSRHENVLRGLISPRDNDPIQRALSTERLLSFISKLSKSVKLNHRSLCLDLAASILAADWFWERHAMATQQLFCSSVTPVLHTGVEEIIEILITRCCDVTATVRCRALGALSDLLDFIQKLAADKNDKGDLIARVHSLVMGRSHDESHRATKSLLDTLRDLCLDDKPLVKVKAISIFGMLFTLEWPVSVNSSAVELLYLNDDDLGLIADRCTDNSVAVRKQAVVTLTQLLSCRRADSSLQHLWVESVLPLIHDPENTIQVKICQGVVDILLLGTISSTSSIEFQATWSLCSKINELGGIKFLKSALSFLKKNSGSGSGASTAGGIMATLDKHLGEIFAAVRKACSLLGDEIDEVEDGGRLAISNLRSTDVEMISRGGWVLLESLISQNIRPAAAAKGRARGLMISADFIMQCWEKKQQLKSSEAGLFFDDLDTRMLQVMSKVPLQMEAEDKRLSLSRELMRVICEGRSDTQSIAAAVSVIFSFSLQQQPNEESTYDFEWLQIHTAVLCNYIHRIFHQHLANHSVAEDSEELFQDPRIFSTFLVSQTPERVDTSILCNAIFLLGEIALLGFSMEEDEDTYKLRSYEPTLPAIFFSESSRTFRIEIPAILVIMIQTLMGYSRFSVDDHSSNSGSSVVLGHSFASVNSSLTQDTLLCNGGHYDKENSSRIRAQAFITMGKLCLRSRQRARDHVTIFLREIQSNSGSGAGGNSAVRSNAILVLGDLCVRFTNLVDRYVGSMAICLQDPDALVRRHSFILLTQLLLQDYLKWRGMLLFRFLVTILDEDEEMASLAKYVLKHTLQLKYPGFIVQNFTESIIVLNNCTDHVTYQTMAALGSDGVGSTVVSMEGIDLHGTRGQEKRRKIYQFMLEDITEEEKIQITANISQDIFSYALDFPIKRTKQQSKTADPILPLEYALIDAFQILQSPLLKIGKKSAVNTAGADSEELEESESSGAGGSGGGADTQGDLLKSSFQKAKTKVLKKLSLQHLIDHMLPLISSLKHLLEATQSPVQRTLMEYLVFVLKTNKAEATEALASDPTLKEEIEYDIKMYEKEKQSEGQRKEILAAERAVMKLEVSTARKHPSPHLSLTTATSTLSHPFSPKREGISSGTGSMAQRLSLSAGRPIGTPVLKKSSEKKRRGSSTEQSFTHSQKRTTFTEDTSSTHLRSFDAEDDFTLRMLSQGEAGVREEEVPKRRWSVSAETLVAPSHSDSIVTANSPRKLAPKKRSLCKENNPTNSEPEKSCNSLPSSPLLFPSEHSSDLASVKSDSFRSPVKKKKKPIQPLETETSTLSSSLTGLGQFAALHQQDRKSSAAGEGRPKKQKGLTTKKKRASGDILGSLKEI